MKKYLIAATFTLASACFAAETPVNLEGTYECQGNELATNTSFKCQMNVKKTGETYASTATCDDGNTYRGNGIYDEKTQRLSTGFINPKKSEETGVAVSEVNADGSMTTAWTYLNSNALGHTACTKQQNKSS